MTEPASPAVTAPRIALGVSGGLDAVLGLLFGGGLLFFALAVFSDMPADHKGWLLKFALTFGGMSILPLSILAGGTVRIMAAVTLRDVERLPRAARLGAVSLVPGAVLGPIVLCGVCAWGGRAAFALLVLGAFWLALSMPALAAVVFTWTRVRATAPSKYRDSVGPRGASQRGTTRPAF